MTIEKLTHGAEREGDSVRIPHDHPSFRFSRKDHQQATAPIPGGVAMLVSQLHADQRAALGLPADEPVEIQAAEVEPAYEDAPAAEASDAATH